MFKIYVFFVLNKVLIKCACKKGWANLTKCYNFRFCLKQLKAPTLTYQPCLAFGTIPLAETRISTSNQRSVDLRKLRSPVSKQRYLSSRTTSDFWRFESCGRKSTNSAHYCQINTPKQSVTTVLPNE